MSALASHKKYWYWVVLVVLSALIAAAAFVAPGKISQVELKREALVAADRLKAQMLKEPDALFYASTSPSLTPQFADILNKSGYGPPRAALRALRPRRPIGLHQRPRRSAA